MKKSPNLVEKLRRKTERLLELDRKFVDEKVVDEKLSNLVGILKKKIIVLYVRL